MRPAILMIALVGVLAVSGAAHATPTRDFPISGTLAAAGCGVIEGTYCSAGGGGSCLCLALSYSFIGEALITPQLGSLAASGEFGNGHYCPNNNFPEGCLDPGYVYYRNLGLVLRAANGDRLVLRGSFSSATPLTLLGDDSPVSGAWSIDQEASTGRFSRFTGEGTYTLAYTSHGDWASFDIDLEGSLRYP